MVENTYRELVREVYIDCLRSVIIIDDDFPTLDEVLSDGFSYPSEDKAKKWHQNASHMREMLKTFRNTTPALIVDMHDGSNVTSEEELDVAAHLHQSDLLILDYNLDKGLENGDKAIGILRKLADNPHFNLIVINTQKDLSKVFPDVALSLFKPTDRMVSASESTIEAIETKLGNSEVSWEDLVEVLTEDPSAYIQARHLWQLGQTAKDFTDGAFAAFVGRCKAAKLTKKQTADLLEHLLKEYQESIVEKLDPTGTSEISCSSLTQDKYWIKGENFFIAFAHKPTEEPKQDRDAGGAEQKKPEKSLLEIAEEALVAWQPHPARLVLSKMRAEIDENGVTVQDSVLSAKKASARWYYDALISEDSEQAVKVENLTRRQSEMLVAAILPNVKSYAERILVADKEKMTPVDACKHHFKVDFEDAGARNEAADEHNVLVSSKNPDGSHLQTGHIFQIDEQYWVCLSPSCDLVPRASKDRDETYGKDTMPFLAIKLWAADPTNEKAREKVTEGRFIHLNLDGENRRFSINNPADHRSNKRWHTLYAQQLGKFDPKVRKLEVSMLNVQDGELQIKPSPAVIVGQLRYEYALSLAQQLGHSLTRIGLDFVTPAP